MENLSEPQQTASRIPQYKGTCLRIGFYMTVILLIREIATAVISIITPELTMLPTVARYSLQLGMSALCLQIIPAVLAVFILKYDMKAIRAGYRKPKQHFKAMVDFPAIYGLGMTVNLLTLIVAQLIFSSADLNESFNTVSSIQPPDIPSALVLFFMLAVIAPVFEEFIFRGALLNALKPYGNGVAVFVSAFLFGAMHGNFSQFFYAFALGIVLGYIAVVTDSIFSTTCLHALFNSVSGIMLIFASSGSASKYLNGAVTDESMITDGDRLFMVVFVIFLIAVVLTAFIGFILMIRKLIHIKRFRLPLVWDEIGNGKKLRMLILNAGMIIAVLLLIDVFSFNFVADGVSRLLTALTGAGSV